MAYKITINKACANREIAVTEIYDRLVAMGWDYVDGKCDPASDIPYTDVNITDNTFTKVGHTLTDGQPVQIQTTGTLPTGLAINTRYYAVNVSGSTFKLATTYNGSAIDISSQGTGNHTVLQAYIVFKSTGENADRIPEYLEMFIDALPTTISFRVHYKYVTATKAFSASGYNAYLGVLTTNQTGFYLWIWGNKNFVYVGTKAVSTYYKAYFGWLKPFFPLQTTFTQPATAGNSAVLEVADTTGFEVGYSYQILGAELEGRDNVTITEVTSSTLLKVTNLPRNYAAGALIGFAPSLFCTGGAAQSYLSMTCISGSIGLTNASVYGGGATPMLGIANLDPDARTNKYILQPLVFQAEYSNASQYGIGAYLEENLLTSPYTGMVIEDTFAVGKLDSGTSTGTNSSTELNDTGKSWTINAFAGKVLIITFGAGSGMIKKIDSNTATKITINSDYVFESTPDATSQYIVCDEGYRYFTSGTGYGDAPQLAVREGI